MNVSCCSAAVFDLVAAICLAAILQAPSPFSAQHSVDVHLSCSTKVSSRSTQCKMQAAAPVLGTTQLITDSTFFSAWKRMVSTEGAHCQENAPV